MTNRRRILAATSLLIASVTVQKIWAAQVSGMDQAGHEHDMHDGMHDHASHQHSTHGDAMHDHAAHALATPGGFSVRRATYDVPDVQLVREDGRSVSLPNEVNDGRPVVLNFIYTTCTAICPMMSQSISQFEDVLGKEARKVHVVSISIDPEQDTPSRLRAYGRKFGAGPSWNHYTGTVAASIAAQQAFEAYKGDKMAHDALTLMRAAPGQPWLRIDGFASGSDLAHQYAMLTGGAHDHSH